MDDTDLTAAYTAFRAEVTAARRPYRLPMKPVLRWLGVSQVAFGRICRNPYPYGGSAEHLAGWRRAWEQFRDGDPLPLHTTPTPDAR